MKIQFMPLVVQQLPCVLPANMERCQHQGTALLAPLDGLQPMEQRSVSSVGVVCLSRMPEQPIATSVHKDIMEILLDNMQRIVYFAKTAQLRFKQVQNVSRVILENFPNLDRFVKNAQSVSSNPKKQVRLVKSVFWVPPLNFRRDF
jgi:hypothetical protein